jgi:hypothetical protein
VKRKSDAGTHNRAEPDRGEKLPPVAHEDPREEHAEGRSDAHRDADPIPAAHARFSLRAAWKS